MIFPKLRTENCIKFCFQLPLKSIRYPQINNFQFFRSNSIKSINKQIYYYKMSHDKFSNLTEQQNNIYFGTESVNRVSFLREDSDFIANAITHPSTRFVFFHDLNPLINKLSEFKLSVLTNGDNQSTVNEGGLKHGLYKNNEQWGSILDVWNQDNKNQNIELRDDNKPTFLFMGLKDESVGLNLTKLKAGEMDLKTSHDESDYEDEERYLDHQGRYQGIPYFAVDLTQSPQMTELVKDHILKYGDNVDPQNLFFSTSRKHYLGFSDFEASLYSHGKMFLDWLFRNKFCPGCGSKVIPIHAGGKLRCTNDKKYTTINELEEDESKREVEKFDCPVKNKSVSNVSFPRTDAVIITAIKNTDNTKVLLSLSKRYAYSKMYACTAGFMEPSETVEVATKREIWEETGVVCSKINIIMTQPWPFPANLMIGCIGTVEFNGINEVIHLGHDRELADAKWFDIEYIRKLIYEPGFEDENPDGILLPSPESIAFSLIKMVIDQATEQNKIKL